MTTPADGASRLLSPLGDSRHRAVACRSCGRDTWAWSAICDACHDRGAA